VQQLHSDEVELGVLLLKGLMNNRRSLLSATAFTNQSCQAMSIANAGWFLNSTRNIVISMTKLVSQTLHFVRRLTHIIINHRETSRRTHTLLGSNRNKIELINVLVCDSRVNNCAGHRVLEIANVSIEYACVNTFATDDVHELGDVSTASRSKSSFDLFDLRLANTSNLAFSNTITVENDLLGISAIDSLETFKGSTHATL
jgi:hypothetical protein